jgi:ubiquinol-cytochrome c reductase cytochrome b subunit
MPRYERLARPARTLLRALDRRLGVSEAVLPALHHPIPRDAASWWNVFGSAALAILVLQLLTGVCLALVYVPSAADAHQSLVYMDTQQTLGWLLRALHFWGSSFMVALVLVHMAQVFLFGAYKYPRETTWIVGVGLLLATLAMAFTGQILRWDQDAYWGLGIGAAITGRVPVIGPELVHLLLGGPIVGGRTLSRFFTIHVFLIPGALIALVALHLRLVLRLGISDPPGRGLVVVPAAEDERYRRRVESDGVPFYPHAARNDLVFSAGVLVAIVLCSVVFGPYGPGGAADPTHIHTQPRPDFFFLWLFAALALLPPGMETFVMLVAPPLLVLGLLALPLLARSGERSPRRRPVAVTALAVVALALGELTWLGESAPWSPVMEAWSSAAVPAGDVRGRSPLELQGALVLQNKQCRNCHRLGGRGGARGPALDDVGARLSRDQLIRQVIQGGGNMPAYGKHLHPAEVSAVVAFLQTLRPADQPPAPAEPAAEGKTSP